MEHEIAGLLKERRLTIATAESCTGGWIAGRLVNVPGISGQFGEGYITYSNEAKERLLGVSHETLARYGAVSSQTAEEMARGAKRAAGADISIVSTGIAGPDGGTEEKPAGLVYLSCCYNNRIKTKRHLFAGDRQAVRQASVCAALTLVKNTIEESIG